MMPVLRWLLCIVQVPQGSEDSSKLEASTCLHLQRRQRRDTDFAQAVRQDLLQHLAGRHIHRIQAPESWPLAYQLQRPDYRLQSLGSQNQWPAYQQQRPAYQLQADCLAIASGCLSAATDLFINCKRMLINCKRIPINCKEPAYQLKNPRSQTRLLAYQMKASDYRKQCFTLANLLKFHNESYPNLEHPSIFHRR